jgi:hypothetical protein
MPETILDASTSELVIKKVVSLEESNLQGIGGMPLG